MDSGRRKFVKKEKGSPELGSELDSGEEGGREGERK